MREYGFWYLDDPGLAPDGQLEKGLEAFLIEADLLEREGMEPDVVEACLWVALQRSILQHEGREGLDEFWRELHPSPVCDPTDSGSHNLVINRKPGNPRRDCRAWRRAGGGRKFRR